MLRTLKFSWNCPGLALDSALYCWVRSAAGMPNAPSRTPAVGVDNGLDVTTSRVHHAAALTLTVGVLLLPQLWYSAAHSHGTHCSSYGTPAPTGALRTPQASSSRRSSTQLSSVLVMAAGAAGGKW
eukprot:1141038-Pelagomonas_calceolata.AAC.6